MLRVIWVVMGLITSAQAVGLRVATFNIKTQVNASGWPNFALGDPGTVDHDSVAAILARINADVVAFQEMHTSDLSGESGDPVSEIEKLGTTLGMPYIHAGSNSGNFDTSLRVVFLSKYPFSFTDSIVSPAGARELTRHCPVVIVDVPGTDADPLLIATHIKAGTGSDDRFRKTIEMKRIAGYLSGFGLAPSDNYIILGDFNPSGTPRSFETLPSGLPSTFSLGSDITLPVSYSTNMVSYFTDPIPSQLDPRQLNGNDGTFQFGQTLDLLLVSAGLAGRPYGTEIYNSALDVSNGEGLPKSGSPLPEETSLEASDHYAVFADFELDQELFDLALAVSSPTISEGDPEGAALLTVTLAAPAIVPVNVSITSNDAAAAPLVTTLTIPANGTQASTTINTSRNFLIDGTRTVTFDAAAPGYGPDTATVQLLDVDSGYVFDQPGETINESFDGFNGSQDPAPWVSDALAWNGEDDGSSVVAGARAYGLAGENTVGVFSDGSEVVLETSYTNGTDRTLTIMDLRYDAEQWRAELGGAADSIEVELVLDETVLPIPELGFDARTDLPSGPVIGGSPVERSVRVEGVAIAPGEAFTLRFRFDPGTGVAPQPADVFINEFHYDNDGTDVGEFVEVVVAPGFTGDEFDINVVFYNGGSDANATAYETFNLDTDFTPGGSFGGYRFFALSLPSNGIQNGGSDGFAVVNSDTGEVLQLISYEGTFDAVDGPAIGMTSVSVGVSETSSTPVGLNSIGLTGAGARPADFSWVNSGVAPTIGTPNTGQSFAAVGLPGQGLAIDQVSVTFVEDSDFDGLADDVDPDDDNDGMDDLTELAFGTDPLDPTSKFNVTHAFGQTGYELSFPGAAGVSYEIEWCDDLVSWEELSTHVGADDTITVPLPSSETRAFFRVKAGE